MWRYKCYNPVKNLERNADELLNDPRLNKRGSENLSSCYNYLIIIVIIIEQVYNQKLIVYVLNFIVIV
jgi:hypothetical protein